MRNVPYYSSSFAKFCVSLQQVNLLPPPQKCKQLLPIRLKSYGKLSVSRKVILNSRLPVAVEEEKINVHLNKVSVIYKSIAIFH